MDFTKVEKFLVDHWPAGLIVLFISIPVIWSLSSNHYAQQISTLNERVKNLELKVEDLSEYKNRLEKLEQEKKKNNLTGGGVVGFSVESLADSLFSPSKPRDLAEKQ